MADIGLFFRQGTLAQLESAELIAGSINVTTDEPAIYIDVPDATGTQTVRKRVGDLIIVPNEEALMADTTGKTGLADGALVGNWSTTALYYAEEEGALLKWNGTSWKQLNALSDVDAAIGDLTTSVGNLQVRLQETNAAVSGNTEKINGLIQTVGEIPEGATSTTVVDYVDEKVSEVDDKVDSLSGTVDSLGTTVSNLNAQVGENKAAVDNSIASINSKNDAQDQAIADLDAAYKAADVEINSAIETLNTTVVDLDNTVKSQGGTIGENAQKIQNNVESIEALQELVAGHTEDIQANSDAIAKEVQDRTNAVSTVDTKLENHISAYNVRIGELEQAYKNADDTTLQNAKTYADSAIEEKLQAADAMTFKGVLGSGDGQLSDLPSGIVAEGQQMVNAGDTYKVSTADTYGPNNTYAYIGDLFIALKDQMSQEDPSTYSSGWAHVSSGYENNYNPHLTVTEVNNEGNGVTIHLSGGAEENLGTEHIMGSENIKVDYDVASSTTTFSLIWGSFEN